MLKYSASPVQATPNVTPMIDVMLVLLIVFMVAAPALLTGVVAEPPKAENLRKHPEEPTDHTLAIDIAGALYLDKQPIAAGDLKAALRALYPPASPNRVLYLRAHKDLAYVNVLSAINVARVSGVGMVGLVSEARKP